MKKAAKQLDLTAFFIDILLLSELASAPIA